LREEIEKWSDPYCANCGICGEDGCCKTERCRYPDIKSELVKELKVEVSENDIQIKDLIEKLNTKAFEVISLKETLNEKYIRIQELEDEIERMKKYEARCNPPGRG